MSPFGYPHREDEKLQRQVGGEQQRKSRENLPPHPLSRPVLRFHRRSRSGSGTARFRKRRLGSRGRIYSMLAEEMGSSTNRGRVIWVLASSRPDLIEVDLKRPGRVDVKIPLFPTTTPREGFDLIRMLCGKRGLAIRPFRGRDRVEMRRRSLRQLADFPRVSGAPGEIRTPDPLLRRNFWA